MMIGNDLEPMHGLEPRQGGNEFFFGGEQRPEPLASHALGTVDQKYE